MKPDSLDTCKRYCAYTNRVRGLYFGMDTSLCASERSGSTRHRSEYRYATYMLVYWNLPP